MGSLSDNGGSWPPEGGAPDGLPDLPPEWGDIVIPDDLSALSDEVAAVRAELDDRLHRTPAQGSTAHPAVRALRRLGAAAVRAPVLIVSIAILVTLASLFASTWPGPARPPATQRTANTTDDSLDSLPALELIGTDGQTVPLRGRLPAVILLVDECDCSTLLADTAAAAPAGTAVLAVVSGATAVTPGPPSSTPPAQPAAAQPAAPPPARGEPVPELRDPTDGLRSAFDFAAPDGTAAVLVVDRTGSVVSKVRRTVSVEDFRPDLARL